MKRLLAAPLFLLSIASVARSQEQALASPGAPTNVAADFAQTSAAGKPVLPSGNWTLASLAPPEASLAALSFSAPAASFNSAASNTFALPAATATFATLADASPASSNPSFDYDERPYRWEIALGFALVRFRSSIYYATAPGLNSAVAYYLKDWIAVEGNVTSAFAPTVFQNEHVKYLGYTAGPKFTFGRSRFEPWAHVLIGGMHIIPETALGQNGFALQAGGGVDYPLNPRISARIQADYLGTHVFGQFQNNAQGAIGLVFTF
jgi:hypothetical protein